MGAGLKDEGLAVGLGWENGWGAGLARRPLGGGVAILIGQREGGAAKDGGVASGLWAWLVQVGGAKATTGSVLLGAWST